MTNYCKFWEGAYSILMVGAARSCTRCSKTNGRWPRERRWTASRTTHPLSGDGLPLSYSDFQVKPTGFTWRDWKELMAHVEGIERPPATSLRLCHFVRIWTGRQGPALPLTQPDIQSSLREYGNLCSCLWRWKLQALKASACPATRSIRIAQVSDV